MPDQILLTALPDNFQECAQLAFEYGLGLEFQTFAYPEILQGNWLNVLDQYLRVRIDRLEGPLALHGAFIDMAPGSADPLIREVTRKRTLQSLDIADALGAALVVFHLNFSPGIHSSDSRRAWTQRNLDFWGPMTARAARQGVIIALENMWEFEPEVIVAVLRDIESPHLRACLDVGHAYLFSKKPLATWLKAFQPYLVHAHLNNTDGEIDAHRALDDGVLDYTAILPRLRALSPAPSFTLEMNRAADMRASLHHLELASQRPWCETPSPAPDLAHAR
ncbi:MAG: sugar phosphate isomerase/epimerase [Anaerolineae bacterium]|nr:sugar phosphate isomerase/epimerase [Anaerolineae bacterium]